MEIQIDPEAGEVPAKAGDAAARPAAGRRVAKASLGNPTASAYLRIFSAASIVWFHTAPDGLIGRLGAVGLALFVCLSFLHAPGPKDFRATVRRSARSLLAPWVFWWVFYAAIAAWVARGVPPLLGPETNVWLLLRGPAMHLWYLPFIFLATIVVLAVRAAAVPLPIQIKTAAAIGFAAFGILLLVQRPELPPPLSQMTNALPGVALGLAYLWVMRTSDRRTRGKYFSAIAVLVSLACIPVWLFGNKDVALGYTGASLAIMLMNARLPRKRFLMRLSVLSLGIYLIHPFALMFIRKFLGADLSEFVLAPMAFTMSAVIAWGMRKTPLLKYFA